ncbi:MAG: ABC transporter substrate binding protein [Pseudomonadota bacterium]
MLSVKSRWMAGVACLGASLVIAPNAMAKPAKCLFVSSYHQGYAWSDGVERGLRAGLGDRCELRQFDMDTKRNKSEEYKAKVTQEVLSLVRDWKPDIVITADDNAAKYIVQPHFKDDAVPVVFCGVNWTADEYGFPYSNVTGMVEVAPIEPMLEKASNTTGGKRAFYLGADTLTEQKNLERFRAAAENLGLSLDHALVGNTNEWIAQYASAQTKHDFVILGSNSGINDWDQDKVLEAITQHSRRLSTTNHGWMMPYTMLGMTKVPEEHGEWSAQTAIAILDGMSPGEIPIVSNRKWDLWANSRLLNAAKIKLPRALKHKAKRVN